MLHKNTEINHELPSRKVTFSNEYGKHQDGYFLDWIVGEYEKLFAVIELKNGKVELIPYTNITFIDR